MKSFIEYLTEAAQRKTYYRGTNNPDEDRLVTTKSLRPSTNHITRQREVGISVSDVPDVGNHFKYLYKLSGIEIGEGSDGEPLLDPLSVIFIEWVKR